MTLPRVRIHLSTCGMLLSIALAATVWIACDGTRPTAAGTVYRLTVIATDGGEIVTPSQQAVETDRGSSGTIVARPHPGYSFARWTVSGDNVTVTYQNAATATFTLNGDDTVRAEFVAVPALPGNVDLASFPTENGVNFLHYTGSWTQLPDFPALSPDTAGPVATLSVATLPNGMRNFGAVLSGYLSIPLDGDYTFYLVSSEGSALYLNDSMVLSNDGVHAVPAEDSVTVALTHGYYLIGVHYFDAVSAPFLSVDYACPDIGIERIPIPKDALYRADTRPVTRITVIQPAGGEICRLGDTIHVRWEYKNPRGQVFAQLSIDNGKQFENICNDAFPGNVTSYDWYIPPGSDSLLTQTALIRVAEYPPFNVTGTSKSFSIVGR